MRFLAGIILLLVLLAVDAVSAQTPTPNPATILQDCAKMLSPDRPNPTGPDAPTIKIVSPVSGTVIRSNEDNFATVQFSVETQNFDLPGTDVNEADRHWHLWLNNGVWAMEYQNDAISYLPYGTWRVCITLADAEHVEIGMPDGILLVVERSDSISTEIPLATPTILPFQRSTPTPNAVNANFILSAIGILVLGVAALGIGFWLGRRNRKTPD
jgi:hypothetical protein